MPTDAHYFALPAFALQTESRLKPYPYKMRFDPEAMFGSDSTYLSSHSRM